MAAKILNWLGTRSHHSHLSGSLVLQARAGSGVDANRAILQTEAVLRAGADTADPGLLRVLRAGAGTQAGRAESGL